MIMQTSYDVLPRTVNRETVLVKDGCCQPVIIYPAQGDGYRQLAEELAGLLSQYAGEKPTLRSDEEVMPGRITALPAEYRQSPLILLGNINTNRVMVNLYSRYRCFTDADFPGKDGYELRTVINPYTNGRNILIAGGSTLAGVKRAVGCLSQIIQQVGRPGEVAVPFLLQLEIEPGMKSRLDNYSYTNLNAPKPDLKSGQGTEIMRVIGQYGMMYAITGDRRYGEYAAGCLRLFNSAHTNTYGDRHYFMERLLHAIYWLEAGGFFTDEEVAHMDRLMLGMLVGAQDNWWRRKDGSIPLGHRHQSKGTYEFLQVARFLLENASLPPQAAEQCPRWIEECQAFMDALCRACIDDQDDETTLNNMANLFWYSLSEERFFFFESGHARQAAMRALALHDNMGAGAGQGGYGELHMSAMYTQQDATTAVSAAAFYYNDGQFKWILENLPHLKEPLRGSIFIHAPIFLHNFGTGEHLQSEEAHGLVGIQTLPITEHQYALNTTPPVNIVPLGHFVNEPETWELAEGVGINRMTRTEGFDKLTMRESFEKDGAYLLLQGYQGGYNWQGHQQAANCIVRFSQFGKIFLIQNSRQHTAYDKNGVLSSNGWDTEGLSPYAQLVGLYETAAQGVTVTSVPEARGAEWRRYILWSKPDMGYFAVIDTLVSKAAGPYSYTCTWRTLGYAELQGRSLTTGQGSVVFHVTCGETLDTRLSEEPFEGAASPYVWRQFRGGTFEPGQVTSFHNLFYARPSNQDEVIWIGKASELSGVIQAGGAPAGWYAVNPLGRPQKYGGIETDAELLWASNGSLIFLAARSLNWPGSKMEADQPFTLHIGRDGKAEVSGFSPVRLVVGGETILIHPRGPVQPEKAMLDPGETGLEVGRWSSLPAARRCPDEHRAGGPSRSSRRMAGGALWHGAGAHPRPAYFLRPLAHERL